MSHLARWPSEALTFLLVPCQHAEDDDDDNFSLDAMEADDDESLATSVSASSSADPGANSVSPLPDDHIPPHKHPPRIINDEKWLLPRILHALTAGFLEHESTEHNHAVDRSKTLASHAASDPILPAADPKQVGFN
jgi:hypothetical protein